MSAPELARLDLTGLDGRELTELAVTLNRAYAKLGAVYGAMIRHAPPGALSPVGTRAALSAQSEAITVACEPEAELRRRLAGGAR